MRRISSLSAFSARPERPGARESECLLLSFVIVAFTAASLSAVAQSASSESAPAEIVQLMVQQNKLRAEHLRYFTSLRHYHVEFHGLGRSLTADMHVKVSYTFGYGKTFQVIDESGSRLLLNHVLKKLIETEQDDSKQQKASLTPSNYNFEFLTKTSENGRTLYVFAVKPKVKNKLLYCGRIWIDSEDYAVTRVEAQPAQSPSFWIKKTDIHHVYAKNGEFWLPETNRSESKIRLGGSALLTIDYGTYQFEDSREIASTGASPISRAGGLSKLGASRGDAPRCRPAPGETRLSSCASCYRDAP